MKRLLHTTFARGAFYLSGTLFFLSLTMLAGIGHEEIAAAEQPPITVPSPEVRAGAGSISLTASASEPSLEDALDVPAVVLAQSYHFMAHMVKTLLPLAERGATLQIAEVTITENNVGKYRRRFEARLAIYRAAIEKRGYVSFAGNYEAIATESCSRAGSIWARGIYSGDIRDLEIAQNGFEVQLLNWYEDAGEKQSIRIQAIAVESAIAFDDPANSDYYLVGEIEDGKIVIRPADDVLDSWPNWANPPKRKDLKNCTVTLEFLSAATDK